MLKPMKNMYGKPPRNGWVGWKYPNEDYPYVFNDDYGNLLELVKHIRQFEKSNGLEYIENLPEVLEDYFCRTCPYFNQFCREVGVKDPTMMDKAKRVISGGKAMLRIKKKSSRGFLKVLEADEVEDWIDSCVGCDQNRYAGKVGHEPMYASDVAYAYGVESIEDVETERHEKLGSCHACGCKLKTKVYLHEENFREALMELPHDMNRLLKARTGDGRDCPQLRRALKPEQLEFAKSQGRVTYKDIKRWQKKS